MLAQRISPSGVATWLAMESAGAINRCDVYCESPLLAEQAGWRSFNIAIRQQMSASCRRSAQPRPALWSPSSPCSRVLSPAQPAWPCQGRWRSPLGRAAPEAHQTLQAPDSSGLLVFFAQVAISTPRLRHMSCRTYLGALRRAPSRCGMCSSLEAARRLHPHTPSSPSLPQPMQQLQWSGSTMPRCTAADCV